MDGKVERNHGYEKGRAPQKGRYNRCQSTQEEKLKALEHALADLDKQYGKGAVMKLGEQASQNVEVISTGNLELDLALGVGGVPKGRVIEIYGPESSGKTTVALHIVAEAQKKGGICAFVDAEHALDPAYAKKLGVNIDELYISRRTPASRPWKLPRRWYAPGPWTWWWWTPWRRWCPRRRSTARWATALWACRPA